MNEITITTTVCPTPQTKAKKGCMVMSEDRYTPATAAPTEKKYILFHNNFSMSTLIFNPSVNSL